ncbi:hypothetical protein CNBA5150 [Cryptococcus deneoformans B-3501A]|uniref:Uncharacterized protein n=1 Tax=Cryptococcus deneoformans (strain JEC21 / ATCC MYA-565) TaxID=214684 RepID=A0A0S2LIE1_CRYD1|nr:hypothetical protein CNA05335 [Cryptococcus neoformans var. neoformans JEC21]XP_777817.1 hypothetical protein CNBA5150 [Cryptococcus neoformans var. neoformans B-3501A]ALO60344.1 hypothetical protein CNA05335 [Cryptococcus neoformans var. neoformans JEC21]EAL23170.1 hypothetical protein CNBA5150 [Cryptococcus neoformans var. neoformans B-3501A]
MRFLYSITLSTLSQSLVDLLGSPSSCISSHIASSCRNESSKHLITRLSSLQVPLSAIVHLRSLFLTYLVCFFKGFDGFMPWDYKSFITNYIGIPIYVFAYIGFKLIRKIKAVKTWEMDLALLLLALESSTSG